MILKWSKQNLIKDLEHVRDGDNEFIDDQEEKLAIMN